MATAPGVDRELQGRLRSVLDRESGPHPVWTESPAARRVAGPESRRTAPWTVVPGGVTARRGGRRALLLAAVVAVLAGTIGVVGVGSRLGDAPPATSAPTVAPDVEPPTFDGITTALPAGTYAIGAFPALGLSIDVPDGWLGRGDWAVVKPGSRPVRDALVTFLQIENLYADPCQWSGGQLDPIVGPSVDDLVAGLVAQRPRPVNPATDSSIAGYAGKRLDLTVPGDLSACNGGIYRTWVEPGGNDEVQLPDQHLRFQVLDIRGTRLVVVAEDYPETPPADLAELDSIIESIRIDGRR